MRSPSSQSAVRADAPDRAPPANPGPEAIAAAVDSSVDERVLVFGSLPPGGRDLDLLVRPASEAAVARTLERHGFTRRGGTWAVFAACSAYSVELVAAEALRLPKSEQDRLFNDAVGIDGRRHLVRPAPHHALLLLAGAPTRFGRVLDDRRRARVEQALAEDRDAWQRAEEHAPTWRRSAALARLRAAYESPPAGRRSLRRHAASFVNAARATRPRRCRVVALSGLDGSGKSSHARALAHSLERLGESTEIVWVPFGTNAAKALVRDAVKGALTRVTTAKTPTAAQSSDDGAARLRERSGLVTHAWTTFIALTNALAHRRAVLRHLGSGKVVIFDRYALDSAVQLRYFYGRSRSFGGQNRLIGVLSPTPVRSYFLDIAAQTALDRKESEFTVDEIRRRADLYREECRRLGVRRLDGERPPDELCAEIARDVWLAL